MQKYIPKNIEQKWQQKWKDQEIYKTDLTKDNKYYVLAEFAYPSGDLHVGHWFTFGGADIYARYKRLQGYNVFFPNGFDSFGLPAEGAAIKRGIHPKDWTMSNIEKMKEQYSTMGASFDFYKNLYSSDPRYFKWNQWIFLKMYEKGLAYRGKYLSNWCPVDQTVLANEAIEGGKCWRCGTQVVQKEIEQWFFKITDYAEDLIWKEDGNGVDWPKSVMEGQNNWIGKSTGAQIKFSVDGLNQEIEVYTTRPDTLYGATFLVISPEHPLLSKLVSEDKKVVVEDYINKAKKKTELERKENKEKTGVFVGSYAYNPINSEKIEIWVADYVLPGYGTGAIMAVPAHDQRDFDFATKFGLKIVFVITEENQQLDQSKAYEAEGILINSGTFDSQKSSDARENITKFLIEKGLAEFKTQYHLHDWSISRQRYWGTPIPVVHCSSCGIIPIPSDQLPIELPYEVDYTPKGKSPLASNEKWINVKCPNCGKDAKRDPDTMDTFVDSSWYFFRYLDPDLQNMAFDTELAKKIMPVNIYFGGAEHTLGHTLYSRFFTKFFKDLGLTDLKEYALKRVNHGIVLGPDGQKMSKSRGNVINPDEEVKKYGADAVRIHIAFFMPYDGVGPWISERIWGPYHFLERVWEMFQKVEELELSKEDEIKLNQAIKKVTQDIENIKFNTAIATLMEWLNYLSKKQKVSTKEYKSLLILLAPFAPHITEELWHMMGEQESIHNQKWPILDQNFLKQDQVVIVVQVNGKVRDNLLVGSSDSSNKEIVTNLALESQKVKKFLDSKIPLKIIYVPGKIINLVV